jgi:DNA-binding NarL/FixJ family response regulator
MTDAASATPQDDEPHDEGPHDAPRSIHAVRRASARRRGRSSGRIGARRRRAAASRRRRRPVTEPSTSKPQAARAGAAKPSPKPSSKISTLLVDDHTLIRQGVRVLLEAEDDIAVVGEAQDGRQAVAMAARLRPDVVVMDIAMPLLNGIEATRQILEAAPATRVLILSAHSDEEYVERITELGAAGYVLKQSSLEDLAAAIRTAHAGGVYVSPSITRRRPGRVGSTPAAHGPQRTPGPKKLTSREAEVLQLIAEGKANKQTAAALHISIKTVEKHRTSLMTKLDIHDVAGLTRYAIAIGSIEGRDRSAAS